MGIVKMLYGLFLTGKTYRQAIMRKRVLQRIWDEATKNCELKPLTAEQERAIHNYWGG